MNIFKVIGFGTLGLINIITVFVLFSGRATNFIDIFLFTMVSLLGIGLMMEGLAQRVADHV